LKGQEEEGDPNPDLSIYNRIGDLFLKLKEPARGADFYDQAVDHYAELGFHNNAIAMCNKVLRNAPGRQTTYLKLAKLYAAKGFIGEAKQNFVEYAERMQRMGKIQHAFAALKEFTDISPESEHLRGMLHEHLKMYGDDPGGGRRSTAGPRGSMAALPPEVTPPTDPKRKTSSLVFLDLDEPSPRTTKPVRAPATHPPTRQPSAPPASPPAPAASLLEHVTPEPDTSLEIETTSMADEHEPESASGGMLDGLETTAADFDDVRRGSTQAPSIRDADPIPELGSRDDLEPTVRADADTEADGDAVVELEPLMGEGFEPEEPQAPAPPPRPAPKPLVRPVLPKRPTGGGGGPRVQPVVPRRPSGATRAVTPPPSPQRPPATPKAPPKAAPPPVKRKTVMEIPPLELEPDFDTATTEGGHEVDDEPLAIDEQRSHPNWVQTDDDSSIVEGGRKSQFIDLGVEGIVNQGGVTGSLVFSSIEETPAAPTIDELEGRVAENPDDAETHQALGEALIEAGQRERGIEELDIAVSGFETVENLQQAQDLVEEILRLDPNSVRHRQKQVELSFNAGDKGKLIDAYLELADTLLRSDLPEKARAVYERVVEHDRQNERAKAALAMLSPTPEAPVATPDKKVRAKDAKMTVRDEAGSGEDFVDLGAMMLDEEETRDTRMVVQDEEPTGDEEQDFQDMLARFKQGIDENIDEADFQSHYDLGIAFKEMGLLDEAIAEFQKALRAPEGKLRTSEALGGCFFAKGAFGVAESVLRRGLELPASGDQERLGVMYWLARSLEEQGRKTEARELYARVSALDIRFMDVGVRVKALAKAK
jgi:tetratricopeptide (TPR) repeat protein